MSPIRSSTHWANSTPPKEWLETRLGRAGTLIAGSGFPHEYQDSTDGELAYYKVGNLAGETGDRNLGQSDHRISRSVARKLGARIIPPGAIVWAKIGAALSLNRRRITSEPCCIDNNMTAFVPRPGLTTTAWMYYWMLALDFGPYANPGAVPSISEGLQARLPVLIPPLQMQRRIAAFLDHETARIDELVREQEQLNELLDEKHRATIKRVVENGLPGTVGSWKRAPFKHVARIRNGRDYKEVEEADGPYPVIGSGGEFARASKYLYDGESVLLGRKGTIDKPLYVKGRFWTVDTMFYTEVVPGNSPKFVYYLSTTFPFDALSTRTALPSMTQEALGAVRVRLPSLAEQRRIVEFLDAEAERVSQISALQTKNIALLRERRSALISAAVTGQLDLRDWQPPERVAVAEVA